jgi:hypothetical protein
MGLGGLEQGHRVSKGFREVQVADRQQLAQLGPAQAKRQLNRPSSSRLRRSKHQKLKGAPLRIKVVGAVGGLR